MDESLVSDSGQGIMGGGVHLETTLGLRGIQHHTVYDPVRSPLALRFHEPIINHYKQEPFPLICRPSCNFRTVHMYCLIWFIEEHDGWCAVQVCWVGGWVGGPLLYCGWQKRQSDFLIQKSRLSLAWTPISSTSSKWPVITLSLRVVLFCFCSSS